MSDTQNDIFINSRETLERLCDVSGRLEIMQLPLFRAAADGLLVVVRIEAPARLGQPVGSNGMPTDPHASWSVRTLALSIQTRHHHPNGSAPNALSTGRNTLPP